MYARCGHLLEVAKPRRVTCHTGDTGGMVDGVVASGRAYLPNPRRTRSTCAYTRSRITKPTGHGHRLRQRLAVCQRPSFALGHVPKALAALETMRVALAGFPFPEIG